MPQISMMGARNTTPSPVFNARFEPGQVTGEPQPIWTPLQGSPGAAMGAPHTILAKPKTPPGRHGPQNSPLSPAKAKT